MPLLKLLNEGDQTFHFIWDRPRTQGLPHIVIKPSGLGFVSSIHWHMGLSHFPAFMWQTVTHSSCHSIIGSLNESKNGQTLCHIMKPAAGFQSCHILFTKTMHRENYLNFKYALWAYSQKRWYPLHSTTINHVSLHCSIVPYDWLAELTFLLLLYH